MAIRQAGEALAKADEKDERLSESAKNSIKAKQEADEAVQRAADAMRIAE